MHGGHGGGGGFHHGGGAFHHGGRGFHHGGGFHHHPHHGWGGGWGGRGWGRPGWGGGFWGPGFGWGGPFCRPGPPPIFGYPGYYYNYPGLVVGTALVGGAALGYYAGSRNTVYVRDRQQVNEINENANVRRYSVVVPNDIYPGESFRVVLDGQEVLITCPNVSGPGETIIVCVEQSNSAVDTGTVVTQQPTIRPAVIAPVSTVPATLEAVPTTASYVNTPSTNYATATVYPSAPPTPTLGPLKQLAAQPNQINSNSVSSRNVGETACPGCTYLNPAAARYCQMCGGMLPGW